MPRSAPSIHQIGKRQLEAAGVKDLPRRHANRDEAHKLADKLRTSTRWKWVRSIYRRDHPLCEDPFGDHAAEARTVAGEEVHHVRSIVTHPDLAFEMDNLANLCRACHGRVSSLERRGKRDEAIALFASRAGGGT